MENPKSSWKFRKLSRKPDYVDACIQVREAGRQIHISRGIVKPQKDDTPTGIEQADEGEGLQVDKPTQNKRSVITGFSDASRRRLRGYVHSMKRNAHCHFVTLTWHENLPTPDEAKRALDTFWKSMRRRYPMASAIWKMEPQKRGYPHFHLLVYNCPWMDISDISEIWHEATSETSDAHRRSGVDVSFAVGKDDGRLQSYLYKYLSKEQSSWPGATPENGWELPGRFWGILSRDCLPVAEWGEWAIYIDRPEATEMICALLDDWGIDLLGIIPPSLTINTRGDPMEVVDRLLD